MFFWNGGTQPFCSLGNCIGKSDTESTPPLISGGTAESHPCNSHSQSVAPAPMVFASPGPSEKGHPQGHHKSEPETLGCGPPVCALASPSSDGGTPECEDHQGLLPQPPPTGSAPSKVLLRFQRPPTSIPSPTTTLEIGEVRARRAVRGHQARFLILNTRKQRHRDGQCLARTHPVRWWQ